MKVLVFGASGATGRLLLDEAVHAGHAVAAFVREPAKLGNHDAVGGHCQVGERRSRSG